MQKLRTSAKKLKDRFQSSNEQVMEIQLTRNDVQSNSNNAKLQAPVQSPELTEAEQNAKQLAGIEKEFLDTEKDFIRDTALFSKENIAIVMAEYEKNKEQYLKQGKVTPEELSNFLEMVAAFSEKHKNVLLAINAKDYQGLAASLTALAGDYKQYTIAFEKIKVNIPTPVNEVLKYQPGFNKLDLGAMVAKPLQRITKIPLLLRELDKVSPASAKDGIRTAITEASKILNDVNEIKRQEEAKQFIKEIQAYKDKPTTQQFKDMLQKINLLALQTDQKAEILRSIHYSPLDPERLTAISHFAKNNQDVAPILVNIVTNEKLLVRLAKDIPKDPNDFLSVFVKSLIQQIKIRQSSSLDGAVEIAKNGAIAAFNLYRNKSELDYANNPEVQRTLSQIESKYQGVIDYEHKEVRNSFSKHSVTFGYKAQQDSSAAASKTTTAPSENIDNTPEPVAKPGRGN